ncbi:hypothetical protein [Hydrogenophaga sp.]|uniref:hypothetical protein n=1 Tax=Hydrogenophaga sp. TaxID=1904254 RepID=UPI0035673A9C
MSIEHITQPLAGERVVALSPQDATLAATDWLRRPNLFPARALTAPTLQGRQRWQAGRIAQRGQALTSGVVRGLGVSVQLAPAESDRVERLFVESGQGLAVSGEDVVLARRTAFELGDLPAVVPPAWQVVQTPEPDPETDAEITEEERLPPPGTLHPRVLAPRFADVAVTAGARLPRVGILVLRPVTVDVSNFDPEDPCDRSVDGPEDNVNAFEDWRVSDGTCLLWYPWPEEWLALPANPLRQRNALAHLIFEAEAALPHGGALPWEPWGVPVALIGLNESLQVDYIDRAAVVRQGGRARDARLQWASGGATRFNANSRLPGLWQARIEQFAGQMAEFDTAFGTPPSPQEMADPFLKLPPCGLLPTSALSLADFRSDFFPPLFTLDAVPVPMEQLDLAIREAAPMAPLDLAVPERVRVLVPVSQASWEPRLLHQDAIDPEFQRTLNRFLLTRSRALGARQGLRNKAALLAHALDGQLHTVERYRDDPLALERESLKPWGGPPPGGGHRSGLMPGLHQHYFDAASEPFRINTGESVFAWVCLDPDNPPRSLMLQWHTSAGWEHRAYWGEDLIALGTPAGSAAHFRAGELPTPGAWSQLVVPAAALGLANADVDGMAFTLFDGRAAYGITGALTGNTWRKWFCNFLPLGARVQGNEAWELLTANDLWVPFVPPDGVVPSLPELITSGGGDIFGGGAAAQAERAVPKRGFNIFYPQATGWRGHIIMYPDTATAPIFAKHNGNDHLSTWVYLDELTPPRAIFAYAVCTGLDAGGATRGFALRLGFWGENRLPELFKAVPGLDMYEAQTLRVGALPQSGTWTQIALPQPDGSKAEGASRLRIVGIAVMVFGGSVAFSDIDIVPTPVDTTPAPPPTPVWPLGSTGDQPTPAFTPYLNAKLELQNGLGVLTPTASSRIGTAKVYTELANDPVLARLSNHERSQLQLRGLKGFADYLRARVDRADDITDFGFAHMQVDMHRIRQMMMSTSDASRLAISPALAAIAKSDSALTVQSQIKDYLATVKVSARATPTASAAPAAAAARATLQAAAVSVSAGFSTTQRVQMQATAQLIQAPKAPLNIVYAMPVVGLSEVRTTAIADRLKQPPSTEARDHALANRHRSVNSLLDILDAFMLEDSGAVPALFQDFEVFGLAGDPFLQGDTSRKRKLLDIRNQAGLKELLLQPPPIAGGVDEASLFTQTVALSDNTIATLRQLEGRLTLYRDAINRCERAEADLKANIEQVDQRLRQFGDTLAEARHDVSVARALMAEEQARIDAVNARRAKILAEEVKFLAYMRPRETSNVLAARHRVVDPALQEAPVPACLRDHHDVPDELEDMLKVVREAPASWFVVVPKLVDQLDRMDLLLRTLQAGQLRTPLLAARTQVSRVQTGKLGNAMHSVITRQSSLVGTRLEAINRLNLPQLAQSTWKHVRGQAQEVISMGDLIDGEHGKTAIARQAADEFNRIGAVCTCLHAEFCGVPPAIRLDWAEMLSEFDEAPNLRYLGNLPRWAEIDSVDRRQMQAYADWLFAQTEPGQPRAIELVNDIVRMCLLLASHAPVGRIITGNLPRPVTAVRPGVRIPLLTLDPSQLRIGMQAVLYRANAVIARAVVEDVGQGEVSARVLHTSALQVDLDVDVRVHFDHASVVSASGVRSAGVFKR